MDRIRFLDACAAARSREKNGIGTLSEKTVHAVLKNYFEPFSDSHERKIGPYVADIIGENGIIEIQTGSFWRLGRKLKEFLEYCPVTVVYPCYAVKNIVKFDPETGKRISSRRSPQKEDRYSVFAELEGITEFLAHANFRLCIMMMEIDELRCDPEKAPSGQKKKRRKNSLAVYDRIPVSLSEELLIDSPEGWRAFLPEKIPEEFTTADLAAAGMDIGTARLVMNVFFKAGFAERIGKKGNAFIYELKI